MDLQYHEIQESSPFGGIMYDYPAAYREACKWNARLIFAVALLAFLCLILAMAYYWETQHPRPRYSPEPRAAQPVMPYDKRSY
jgi:energy-converting hydrogenase Eha subunit F